MDEQIAKERSQLIRHWTIAFTTRTDWTAFSQIPKIVAIANGAPPLLRSKNPVGDLLRSLHNELGYMAGYGGLCAGAIFRTQSFIVDPRPRIGSRQKQTVHIEHTVPICVLAAKLREQPPSDGADALAWLLKHSVATAFRKGDDKKYLKGVHRTTDAFENGGRPFMRYKRLFDDGGAVWNVFDKQRVDNHFSFTQHLCVVIRLLEHVGADKGFIRAIESRA